MKLLITSLFLGLCLFVYSASPVASQDDEPVEERYAQIVGVLFEDVDRDGIFDTTDTPPERELSDEHFVTLYEVESLPWKFVDEAKNTDGWPYNETKNDYLLYGYPNATYKIFMLLYSEYESLLYVCVTSEFTPTSIGYFAQDTPCVIPKLTYLSTINR